MDPGGKDRRVGCWPLEDGILNAGGKCGKRRSRLGKAGGVQVGRMFAVLWAVSEAGASVVKYLALELGLL